MAEWVYMLCVEDEALDTGVKPTRETKGFVIIIRGLLDAYFATRPDFIYTAHYLEQY